MPTPNSDPISPGAYVFLGLVVGLLAGFVIGVAAGVMAAGNPYA